MLRDGLSRNILADPGSQMFGESCRPDSLSLLIEMHVPRTEQIHTTILGTRNILIGIVEKCIIVLHHFAKPEGEFSVLFRL